MGNESKGENICEGLDEGSPNSDQVQPTWKVISLDGSDSETDIDDLEQTDSASCQLVSSGSGSNNTNIAAQGEVNRFTRNTSENGLIAKDETKWEYIKFSSELKGKLQASNVLTESEGYPNIPMAC